MDRQTNIQYLKGVGEKRAKLLNKLEIFTVGDLLRFYPRDYMDWSRICSITGAPFDENCCVRAVVNHKPRGAKIRKGMTIYRTVATDGEGGARGRAVLAATERCPAPEARVFTVEADYASLVAALKA